MRCSASVVEGAPLLRLAVQCPACGARPARRITELERDLHRPLPPELVVGTQQCQGRRGCGCGVVYPVTARAYQQAEPDP